MIMAYGLGALAGPPLGGVAMDMRNPQGLPWLFVAAVRRVAGGRLTARTHSPGVGDAKLRCASDAVHIRTAKPCIGC